MFNTLFENLFVSQSLLKERRRPPTGGLRGVIGSRGFLALVPFSGVENDPEASLRKTMVTALTGIAPLRAFPVEDSFLIVVW